MCFDYVSDVLLLVDKSFFLMCGIQSVQCAAFSLCYVQNFVCVVCGIQSVLCAEFCLSYVRNFVCVMCSL